MAEPVPSAATDADAEQRVPANAEDRKAAAALSALNANKISQSGTEDAGSKIPSAAAQEALGQAMSRLEIAAGAGAGKAAAEKKDEVVKKKAIKVAAEDVTLLVEELDLTKNKATELLKAHDGDATKAIKAFISPAVAVV